jgi:hypothetical protein
MAGRFALRWGEFELDALVTGEVRGRDLVELRPMSGGGGLTLDSGPTLRRCTVTLLWVSHDTADDPLARREAFLAAVTEGNARTFVHPLDGAVYAARVGQHQESNRPDSTPEDQVEFVEDPSSTFSPTEPGAGVEPTAGAQNVAVAAQRADDELAKLELESSEPAAAAALAESWEERADETNTVVDARRVATELDSRTSGINAEVQRLELSSTPARYQAYVAMLELASALRQAAAAATQRTAVTTTITLDTATGLLPLCASIDPELATELYHGIRALNQIDTPMLVPAGTRLVVPVL